MKNYFFYAAIPDSGIIEMKLDVKSDLIDSLDDFSGKIYKNSPIQVYHPYFLFEVNNRKIFKRIDGRTFHKHLKFY